MVYNIKDFLRISKDFQRISQIISICEDFRGFSEDFRGFPEDFRGFPRISMKFPRHFWGFTRTVSGIAHARRFSRRLVRCCTSITCGCNYILFSERLPLRLFEPSRSYGSWVRSSTVITCFKYILIISKVFIK